MKYVVLAFFILVNRSVTWCIKIYDGIAIEFYCLSVLELMHVMCLPCI
jgi:hypothetical protein